MRGCPRRLPQQAGARAQDRQAGGDSDDAASDLDADADAADDVDDAESEDADELGGRGSACAPRRRPPARLALGGGLPDEPAAAPAVGTPTRAHSASRSWPGALTLPLFSSSPGFLVAIDASCVKTLKACRAAQACGGKCGNVL